MKTIESYEEELNYLSFNGGKDCLVVFLLFKLLYVIKEKYKLSDLKEEELETLFPKVKNNKVKKNWLRFIYFANLENFTEEENYVLNIVNNEEIETVYLYSDYIRGLHFVKSNFQEFNKIFMGIRVDDLPITQQSNDKYFEKSTSPYPSFDRIYPILNWTFEDVWRLIILLDYPYLSLYNKGYTSIGKMKNTQTNINLQYNESIYLPAYCLINTETERQFRNK